MTPSKKAGMRYKRMKNKLEVTSDNPGALLTAAKASNTNQPMPSRKPADAMDLSKLKTKKKTMKKTFAPVDDNQMMKTKKKMAKTFEGKSTKLGGGGRFAKVVSGVEKSGKSPKAAKAIAAVMGRKALGTKKMTALAVKGKERAEGKMKTAKKMDCAPDMKTKKKIETPGKMMKGKK